MSTDPTLLKDLFFIDLERELAVTRKVLAAVPAAHFEFKPHEKSMSLIRLAIHIADLCNWIRTSIDRDVLEIETVERSPATLPSTDDLLALFDQNAAALRKAVADVDPHKLSETWTMRSGGQVFTAKPHAFVYRTWSLNHLIHHRGALCIYLRLLNIPVPTVYFNTADNMEFVLE